MMMRILIILLLFSIPTVPGVLLAFFLIRSRDRVGRNSIKYAIDHLPMGLAFYEPDGMVLLSNLVINSYCERTTKKPLMNCRSFLNDLYVESLTEPVPEYEVPDQFMMRQDDRMYQIRHREIPVQGRSVFQMTIVDLTDLYENEARLLKEAEQLQAAQEKLKSYDAEAEELARNEAFLAAKTRIHDMLGQELLATRYFLTEPQERLTAQDLIDRWDTVLKELMRSEGDGLTQAKSTMTQDTMQALKQAASAIGLRLKVEGAFPSDSARLARLIVSCARVCMTNAVRHGNANEMTISFSDDHKEEGGYTITFSNNGIIPSPRFVKGGGLNGLERTVEEAQGSVSYRFEGSFSVVVKVGSI